MADQKISELTVDASLDGSEIVPVVQNGNKRTTAAAIAGTLPDATTSTAGKLSAADKTRLDQLGADDSPTFAGLTITGTDPVVIPHLHADVAGTLYFHVKNTSGGTLTKGTPVSVVGAVGDTTTLEVVATNSGVAGRTHAHGLLYSELANNGFGHAVVLGELQGVNTAAFAPSSEWWVSAAGGTTGTRPATAAQQVATVGRQHATTGTLLVSIEGVEPTPAQIGAAPAAQGVTNGNSHNHDGGDGAQIAYSSLSGLPGNFTSVAAGLVPASGGGTSNFLRADGTFAAPPGGGTKTLARFTARDNQPPASNFATLDTRNSVSVLEFDAATEESAAWISVIPEGGNLTNGLLVRIWWLADTATSGNVRWAASLERSGTDLDADSFDAATEVTSAANGTSGIETVAEITCTAIDSLAAGERFRLRIARKAADATNDTMTGDAQIVAVEVRGVA